MNTFLDQFARRDDAQSDEVARRLEAGEAPRAVAEALGLAPIALVAAIARVALGAEESQGLTLVQVAPVHPRLAEVVADEAILADLFPSARRPARLTLSAGLLQVLDAWEASHTAAQEADDLGETATSAAWHMVAHRREPDPGNARYWARRVNSRGAFAGMVERVTPLLTSPGADPAWMGRMIDAGGGWDPMALIDLCDRVDAGSPRAKLARRIQRLEMLVLLDASTAALGGERGL